MSATSSHGAALTRWRPDTSGCRPAPLSARSRERPAADLSSSPRGLQPRSATRAPDTQPTPCRSDARVSDGAPATTPVSASSLMVHSWRATHARLAGRGARARGLQRQIYTNMYMAAYSVSLRQVAPRVLWREAKFSRAMLAYLARCYRSSKRHANQGPQCCTGQCPQP